MPPYHISPPINCNIDFDKGQIAGKVAIVTGECRIWREIGFRIDWREIHHVRCNCLGRSSSIVQGGRPAIFFWQDSLRDSQRRDDERRPDFHL
ncbi:hypothetical protein LB505_012650 [Fusarium chuoi]|nr:hypothetical protein LB505_012650 [Fusarium chuoi]